jgi:hypothetical protein
MILNRILNEFYKDDYGDTALSLCTLKFLFSKYKIPKL